MTTRRNIMFALLGVAVIASIAFSVSFFIQPILPSQANFILILIVAALTGAAVILGEINNISELIAKWSSRGQGQETKSVAQLLTTTESTRLHDFDELWKTFTSSQIQNAIKDQGCTWIIPWPARSVESVRLIYDKDFSRWKRYDSIMSQHARDALERWRLKIPDEFNKHEQQPWGEQVRLEKVEAPHDIHGYEVRIHLSPSKFLYYVAIQAQLGESETEVLRERTFRNALNGLSKRETLELPSQFAVHIAIISCDGKILLRQRTNETPFYPSAWEAGVGEFMHGHEYKKKFPHFDQRGNPDLPLYLKNAVAEELSYRR